MAAESQHNSEGTSTASTQHDFSATHEESTYNHVSIETMQSVIDARVKYLR